MLELGQCATPMPRSAKKARSSASSMQQCANQQSFWSHPISLSQEGSHAQPNVGNARVWAVSAHKRRRTRTGTSAKPMVPRGTPASTTLVKGRAAPKFSAGLALEHFWQGL